MTAQGDRVPSRADENVLKLSAVMAAQLCRHESPLDWTLSARRLHSR